MHPGRLRGSSANHTVPASDLTASGDLSIAMHADPQHREAVEVYSQSRLGLRSGEKDIVIDDPRTGSSHCSHSSHPGERDLTESLSDTHLSVFAERHSGVGVHQ